MDLCPAAMLCYPGPGHSGQTLEWHGNTLPKYHIIEAFVYSIQPLPLAISDLPFLSCY